MLVIFITIREIKPLIESTIETKNKQAQVNEYELFIQFDIDKAKSILNDYIDDYMANYAFYNFAVQSLEYINQEDAETMIKEITKSIVINLSELYIFYVKMLRNISNDEEHFLTSSAIHPNHVTPMFDRLKSGLMVFCSSERKSVFV